jgi:hypothetical protein
MKTNVMAVASVGGRDGRGPALMAWALSCEMARDDYTVGCLGRSGLARACAQWQRHRRWAGTINVERIHPDEVAADSGDMKRATRRSLIFIGRDFLLRAPG